MIVSDDLILRDFHLRRLCASHTPEKTEMPSLTRAPFVEQFPLSRYYFSVQTILRVTCNDTWARRTALKSRQRAVLVDLEGRTLHQRQYFRKFRLFDTTGACTKLAAQCPAHAVGHAKR